MLVLLQENPLLHQIFEFQPRQEALQRLQGVDKRLTRSPNSAMSKWRTQAMNRRRSNAAVSSASALCPQGSSFVLLCSIGEMWVERSTVRYSATQLQTLVDSNSCRPALAWKIQSCPCVRAVCAGRLSSLKEKGRAEQTQKDFVGCRLETRVTMAQKMTEQVNPRSILWRITDPW